MACHKEPPFTALGKQVLSGGAHFADAADPAVAERIAAALNASGWQPIESAPRDGRCFVTANFHSSDGEYEINSYAPYTWKSYEETEPGSGLFRQTEQPMGEWSGSNMHRATHWMALPIGPLVP